MADDIFTPRLSPGRLLADYHTAVVQCHCKPGATPLVIVGWGGIICPHCQKLWQIQPKEGGGINLLMTPPEPLPRM